MSEYEIFFKVRFIFSQTRFGLVSMSRACSLEFGESKNNKDKRIGNVAE